MTDAASAPSPPIPADDLSRKLTVADPENSKVRHVAVAGDAYSILVSGGDRRTVLLDRHDGARWQRRLTRVHVRRAAVSLEYRPIGTMTAMRACAASTQHTRRIRGGAP